MCGIFAVSSEKAFPGEDIILGLQKLEYRGYDSWGVVLRDENAERIFQEKQIGKISDAKVSGIVDFSEGIGHSRWATHGGISTANAHPHTFGKVTLVHNGICENFMELRDEFGLAKTLQSETDSEVVAGVLNTFFEQTKDPKKTIKKAVEVMSGRFALLVFFEGISGIFAVRKGSPLILGRTGSTTFLASDIPAFLQYTQTVNYLDDGEMVHIQGGSALFFSNESLAPVEKRNIEVPWKEDAVSRGNFPHFMIKEIFEQKETIARSLEQSSAVFESAIDLIQKTNGCYIIACGTAHKVAMVAEYFFAKFSRKKMNIVPASEMSSFQNFVGENTLVLAISQSGETADILEVCEKAKQKNAKILSVTNVESSSLARMADANLPINAGPEKAVASTKASTAQMGIMFLLAQALSAQTEDAPRTVLQNLNRGKEILQLAAGNINDMLNPRYEEHIRSIAKKIFENEKLFIIGRNEMYPMALESSIKIQEVSYISAMGFAAGELKHGPIALVEKGTPCIILGDDPETISNAIELKSRGAVLIGISAENSEIFDEWIRVPNCAGVQCIASIIPVQILAYHLALFRNLDPDKPRNLAKSVTVK